MRKKSMSYKKLNSHSFQKEPFPQIKKNINRKLKIIVLFITKLMKNDMNFDINMIFKLLSTLTI